MTVASSPAATVVAPLSGASAKAMPAMLRDPSDTPAEPWSAEEVVQEADRRSETEDSAAAFAGQDELVAVSRPRVGTTDSDTERTMDVALWAPDEGAVA